jgi:hypothetical protein
MKAILRMACICALFAAGCSSTKDISNDPSYASERGDYVPGATYRLMQDVTIQDWHAGRSFFDPPEFPMRYSLMPIYPGNPVDPNDVVHMGVRLQLLRVLLHQNIEMSWTFAIARILDGPRAGTEADFSYISHGGKIAPEFLQRVAP